jgi:glucose/arabinose dehydrogenase
MNKIRYAPLLILIVAAFSFSHCKKSQKNVEPQGAVETKDSIIVQNLAYPWEITWGPDNHIWMTERGGRISRVNPATGIVTPLLLVSEVQSTGEGGMLGLVLHPNFSIAPQVFVVYNYNSGAGYREKVVRYNYNGTTLDNPFTIIDNIQAANIHNGSRLLIIGDKLFISTGDAANSSLAQNISSPNGKILRLNLDGSIPTDNPVANNPYWTWGHRNPQGLVFANNILYSSEHGPGDNDEINIIEKGRNYGWPNVHGACDLPERDFCSDHNVKEPVLAWSPTLATCGLDYYNSDLIPQWKNSLLMATLKNSRLYQMKLDDSFTSVTNTNEYFTNKYGRMRDICISPDGKVYICTSNGNNDKIIMVTRK